MRPDLHPMSAKLQLVEPSRNFALTPQRSHAQLAQLGKRALPNPAIDHRLVDRHDG